MQQLTCNIDLSCSFYSLFFSFDFEGESPGEKILKKCEKKSAKKCEKSETILPFSCRPLVFSDHEKFMN